MNLRDPFAAYTAEGNLEAHIICGMLQDAGIPAFAIEDISQVVAWVGGLIPWFHKPQIWIERSDMERARPILADYEKRADERRAAELEAAKNPDAPIIAVCDECGEQTEFSATYNNTVQNCPKCGAFMDVSVSVEFEGWEQQPDPDVPAPPTDQD